MKFQVIDETTGCKVTNDDLAQMIHRREYDSYYLHTDCIDGFALRADGRLIALDLDGNWDVVPLRTHSGRRLRAKFRPASRGRNSGEKKLAPKKTATVDYN